MPLNNDMKRRRKKQKESLAEGAFKNKKSWNRIGKIG
jgi:hypothetical protein